LYPANSKLMKNIKISENEKPKEYLNLLGLDEKFNFLIKLYNLKKFPKVLMLTGKKGIGKYTLINHFLTYVFDKDNYDSKNKIINNLTDFYKQYSNNIFPNIIYLSGNSFNTIKVDDIRKLKSTILKSTMSNRERFVVLDDIELFNLNSLNALLKIIEEPAINNYFILINNKTKPLIETISSRTLEIRVTLTNTKRVEIIDALINKYNLQPCIDYNTSNLTPGDFIFFNNICQVNDISIDGDFIKNLKILLDLYKKDKNVSLINMILFLTNNYFYKYRNNKDTILKNIENKNFVINNVNKFFSFNLNQTALINAINNKLQHE
jgi:DNA polymerase-3 subunit delta'